MKLRQDILPSEIANHTKGAYRSAKAKSTFKNGRDYEAVFYKYLCKEFAEIAVHEHKLIRPGNVSSDFFIYLTEANGVVVDIFYANSIINLVNVVNIKLKRYGIIDKETYLVVVGNPVITQADIDSKMDIKKLPLPSHVKVVTDLHFQGAIIPSLRQRSVFSR